MKLAIIGSRTFNDFDLLVAAIRERFAHDHIDMIISGGAKGADALAERFAREQGIELVIFPARWSEHGRAAGPIRNKLIIGACDAVIAFWDGSSKGTGNSIGLARASGKRVEIVSVSS